MKKVLLLFSAGIDSTYLMWNNLKRGYKVTPVYVYIKNNNQKCDVESVLGNELIELFQEEFPNQLEDFKISGQIHMTHVDNNAPNINQVPLWIMTILYQQNTEYHDEVQIGYAQADTEVIPHIEDIKRIYHSYQSISKQLINITFPILHKTKDEIINELPEKYFEKTVSCEYPKYDGYWVEHCLECYPCKRKIKLNNSRMNKRMKDGR